MACRVPAKSGLTKEKREVEGVQCSAVHAKLDETRTSMQIGNSVPHGYLLASNRPSSRNLGSPLSSAEWEKQVCETCSY
jgi:hypothetical protein